MASPYDPTSTPHPVLTVFPLHVEAVTPDDGVDLPHSAFVRVGTAGNVSYVAFGDSNPVTLVGLAVGDFLPNFVKRVRATGTTAGSLTAHY